MMMQKQVKVVLRGVHSTTYVDIPYFLENNPSLELNLGQQSSKLIDPTVIESRFQPSLDLNPSDFGAMKLIKPLGLKSRIYGI